MTLWQNYIRPASIPEALQALASAPGLALPIAGGTDLLLDLQQGNHPSVHTLVDLTSIPELNVIEIREGELYIGATTPLDRIVASPLVQEHARALTEACGLVGGPQVRNVATLGGNVGHALPAADGTIALMALGAQAIVVDLGTCRCVPVSDLFLGPGKSALKTDKELLAGFTLPLCRTGQASAFQRVMRTQGIALPILNLALWLHREGDRIVNAQLAVGPSGPTPRRSAAAEAALRGQTFSSALLNFALDALLKDTHFRTSPHRATARYRRHLAGVLLIDTLTLAWERARTNP
jgi:carbon-monoxide dehydrogenase medium subunit